MDARWIGYRAGRFVATFVNYTNALHAIDLRRVDFIAPKEAFERRDFVIESGYANFPAGCTWLVQVPSGNPEPDFPSDLYNEVECGAPVAIVQHGATPADGWSLGYRCTNGHEHLPLHIEHAPGGPAWQREQRERYEQGVLS